MPFPLLAAAGRGIMQAVGLGGRAGGHGASKAVVPGARGGMPGGPGNMPGGPGGPGPRGPNEFTNASEKKGGKNSPGDMLGNTLDVVNIGATAASFMPHGQKPPQQTPPADGPTNGKKINFDT